MRYVMKIAYDGTDYAGWQRQKNALSVQEVLEDALERALGVTVRVVASGRTDAGVHAVGTVRLRCCCTCRTHTYPRTHSYACTCLCKSLER